MNSLFQSHWADLASKSFNFKSKGGLPTKQFFLEKENTSDVHFALGMKK